MKRISAEIDGLLEGIPTWGRWALVVPSGALASILFVIAFQIVYIVERLILHGTWLDVVLLNPIAFGAATFAFVAAGAEVAPARRKTVALALTLVPAAFIAITVLMRLKGSADPDWPLWQMLLDLVGVAVGGWLGVAYVLENEPA
jgi:hypothetical protein